jgi:membrane protein implicated in regulation of membrane protease activity
VFLTAAFVWALLGLLMIGAELFVPGLVIVFFGIGALVTAGLSALLPGFGGSLVLQILTWLGATGLSFAFLRRRLSRVFRGKVITEDGTEVTGKHAVVTERLTPKENGRVRFEGTSWTAASYSETFEPGETVEILRQEGLTLYVTRSILDPESIEGPGAEGR